MINFIKQSSPDGGRKRFTVYLPVNLNQGAQGNMRRLILFLQQVHPYWQHSNILVRTKGVDVICMDAPYDLGDVDPCITLVRMLQEMYDGSLNEYLSYSK
ncbi:MAG: hypothetical protein KIH63_004635 [Candidatus Saccharibacteria bacterium]|nr:hypothetical protein [Candidatus Saccharibacteria bacterium]